MILILKHMQTLKVLAQDLEPVSRARIAAMLLYRGKLVSIGFSQWKTHPFAAKYAKHPEAIWLHAEVDCINKAKKKLTETEFKKSTLLVVRVKSDRNGNECYGIAKPCAGCSRCITDHGIKRVIYTETTKDATIAYTTMIY